MVSAFASETRLSLGQIAVEAHSNESPALRALLSLLSLEGGTVTLEALPAQPETAQALRDQGADDILARQGNQGTLCEDVGRLREDSGLKIQDRAQTVEADQGRIETREAHPVTELAWLQEPHAWPGLAWQRQNHGQARRQGFRHGTDPVPLLSVEPRHERAGVARPRARPWTIENSLDWVLDVVMREGQSRARKDHAPVNLAILRRLARNRIERNQDKGSNRLKFKPAGWDDRFLRKLIAQC
jgi:predicted transposase YbfD/YdcC